MNFRIFTFNNIPLALVEYGMILTNSAQKKYQHTSKEGFTFLRRTANLPGSPTSSKCDSPLTLVPEGSILCTPPIRAKATASLTAYKPYTCEQKLERMWFLACRGASLYFAQNSTNSHFSSSVTTTPALCSLLTDT